jgi:fused signal recognition particle receptor
MALGFIRKVFSFGKKEVVETPAEDEPLAPLNFEALKAFTTESAPAPVQPPEVVPAAPPPEPVKEPPLPEVAPEPSPPQVDPEPEVPAPSTPPSHEAPPAVPQEVPAPAPAPRTPPELAPEPAPVPVELPPPPSEGPPALPPEAPAADPVEAPAPPLEAEPEAPRAAVDDSAREPVAPITAEAPVSAPVEARSPAPDAPPPPTQSGKVTVAKSVERKAEEAPAPVAPEPRRSWFQRLREGLSRSSRELSGQIAGIFTRRKLDEETLEELEDVLIRADLGVETALRITDTLASSRYGRDVSDAEVRAVMAQEVEKVLIPVARPLELDLSHKPHVILVVGVNGTGKTTTIGKLAAKLRQGGLSVMLAAGDTFRAAAIEQLKIWGERTGSPVVSSKLGADAAGLAWDAFQEARKAGSDVLIIDTAGRLQNKAELMAELEKIVRVLGKHDPEAPHTVLQTVDATTGQNALNQVEIFRNIAGVNGLVMTKLDGTARGGILVAIAAKHRLPVYFIGVGEQIEDLEPFSAGDFAKAIAGVE